MRLRSAITCSMVLTAAGIAHGQVPSVEFRIVERQGQSSIPSVPGPTPITDAVLNYAVQARVVGGTPTQFLGNFSFDIIAQGEADSWGTLTKMLISNADGTYAANTVQANNATVTRGGLASIYCYLAGISAQFNGLINISGATFTNHPESQEIGDITGSPTGGSLLLLTDLSLDGNPDTYSGSGTTAPIDPLIASTYLGAADNFVDVYRFKYTVSNTSSDFRIATFNLANLSADVGTGLQLSNGVWGPIEASAATSSTGVNIAIGTIPSPGGGAILALAGTLAARRRRAAQ